MRRARHSSSLVAPVVALAFAAWIGAPAVAGPVVHGPFIDETTGGDWRGTYGQCFFLVPDSRENVARETVGPDWCTDDIRQYRYNNCYGGMLFDNDPAVSSVDWRIHREAESGVEVATWSTDLAVADASPQWNPCLQDFRHTTYANPGLTTDSLSIDLNLDVKGDITLAYYFTGAASKCRALDFTLSLDGVERSAGAIEDFAAGKYVVFKITQLRRSPLGTTITLSAADGEGSPSCETSEIEEVNTHISGVFVGGTTSAEPNRCRHLIGTHRQRAPARPGF